MSKEFTIMYVGVVCISNLKGVEGSIIKPLFTKAATSEEAIDNFRKGVEEDGVVGLSNDRIKKSTVIAIQQVMTFSQFVRDCGCKVRPAEDTEVEEQAPTTIDKDNASYAKGVAQVAEKKAPRRRKPVAAETPVEEPRRRRRR
jgi:hypothetical protein